MLFAGSDLLSTVFLFFRGPIPEFPDILTVKLILGRLNLSEYVDQTVYIKCMYWDTGEHD